MGDRTLRPTPRLPVAALALTVALAACGESGTAPANGEPASGEARLSVYLTDAPGDVASVWVEVVDVRLVGQSGPPISLLDEPLELIDLLELQDRSVAIVEDRSVEPGSYGEIRFVIGGAVLETVGGSVFVQGGASHPEGLPSTGTLHCPSCAQSGIKVKFSGDLRIEPGSNALLLDFDVTQSFGRQAGQSGMWVMHPVVKGAVGTAEEIEGGGLEGRIRGQVTLGLDGLGLPIDLPVCGGAQRTVADFTPMATSTALRDGDGEPFQHVGQTNASGEFQISVLPAGEYSLGVWNELRLEGAVLTWLAEVTPATVEVGAGAVVDGVTYTLLAATCTPD